MKRVEPPAVAPLHERLNIDIGKTVILAGEDPGLRQHGHAKLFVPPKGEPGLGILLASKNDYFHGMPGEHDFGFTNMMKLSAAYMVSQQEVLCSAHALFVEQQMNTYNENPNAPGMMSVFAQCYAAGEHAGIPTFVVPPLSTANSFPYIYPLKIPDSFEPKLKGNEKKRRHAWNKHCICRVAHEITTPREMESILTINEDMQTIASGNGYRFKAAIDDPLDPLTDMADFLLELYKDGVIQFDLLALRMKYMQAGYQVVYLVYVSMDADAHEFPQKWRLIAETKVWQCCIKISYNVPLSKLLLANFRFDHYVSNNPLVADTKWKSVTTSQSWDDLFAFFVKK